MALPWHEDDDFWITYRQALFPPSYWEDAVDDVHGVLTLTGVDEGARILDVCSGPGRHTLAFARHGYRVTGLDRTRPYLDEARERARVEGLQVELVLEDARRFTRPGAFDLAVNLYTSFGYFSDPGDDVRVLENIFQSLRAGGQLVIETLSKETVSPVFGVKDWTPCADGTILIEERRLLDDFSRIENRWAMLDGTRVVSHVADYRIYSATELGALLRDVGFEDIECYGNLYGAPFDRYPDMLVMVARRP